MALKISRSLFPIPATSNPLSGPRSGSWSRDYVFLRGWGVMTPVAIKTAAKTGFPVDRIIGGIWSGSEEDVRPAGAVGKGYKAVTPFPAGRRLRDPEAHQATHRR